MNKKGRPKSENPKQKTLNFRIDDATLERLDKICKKEGVSKTSLVRRLLLIYLSLQELDTTKKIEKEDKEK